MNTNDLIARLSTAPAAAPPMRASVLALLMVAAIVVPSLLFFSLLGMRHDMARAWSNPVVPFKTILPLLTCALSMTLLLRLSRPEARLGLIPLAYLVPLAAALVLWVGAFVLRAPADRFAEVGMASLAECLGGVLVLSLAPTFVALRVMRTGASTQPGLSAFLTGLTAASGAAVGYSLFCTRDNPLFFVTWYGLAILIVTGLTAWLGKRMLVW